MLLILMMKNMQIKVNNCLNCPFSSKHLGGRAESALISDRRRLYLKCNIQDLGSQYSKSQKYKCFETCPLEKGNIEVQLNLIKTINNK